MLKLRLKSFKYAWNGLIDLLTTQPNAQIHLVVTLLVLAAGLYFRITATEWCLVLLTIALVFAAEAFNTALEYLTNLVSPDYHPLAGKTKDVAAGGVLIAAFIAVIIGIIIFLPKVMELL
ncbi:MAG: diacylglycerol kinase family protein [Saprospiraceae bacterium]